MTTKDYGGTVNPTAVLPRLASQPTATQLATAICHLGLLYSPSSLSASSHPVLPDDEGYTDALDSARVDESERRYAMSWLTRLIGTGLFWLPDHPQLGAEALLDLAGRVLGGHVCIEEAGAIMREFTFPLSEPVLEGLGNRFEGEVKLSLRDDPLPPSVAAPDDVNGEQTSKHAAEAVGVQTWAAAIILSDMFVRRPDLFHPAFSAEEKRPLSIGELGAGTGLVGMAAAKALHATSYPATVVMSDYHDQVLANLEHNLACNFSDPAKEGVSVAKVDWQDLHRRRRADKSTPVEEKHDLLLLADVIYSPEHALWLHSSIGELLVRDKDARAHIVIALRTSGKFEGLCKSVERAFGATRQQEREPASAVPSLGSSLTSTPIDTAPGTPCVALYSDPDALRTRIDELQLDTEPQLEIRKITRLEKKKGRGRPDETGYLWFEIGWMQ